MAELMLGGWVKIWRMALDVSVDNRGDEGRG